MTRLLLILCFFTVSGFCNQLSAQFVQHLSSKQKPWTFEPNIPSDNFHFVIIGDLTGGEEIGVFETAIEKINQMAPDFVMCVGDLIEGYTLDQPTIDNQWKSLQKRLGKLNAPFFYLPGNHDFSNNKLAKTWLNKLGADYYSFTVNHSLFLIINMFEPNTNGLSKQQVSYLQSVLKNHNEKYPVYVFSHAPLWKSWKREGYNEIDSLINSFQTTFFCGHEHHYLFKEDKGQKHYMLAKTGGGFEKVNVNLGEFDHFLWITANKKGHSIANILLDGIISPEVVDNSTELQVNILRNSSWFNIEPSVVENNSTDIVKSQIILSNRGDFPLFINGELPGNERFVLSPKIISEEIPAGRTVNVPIEIKSLDNNPVENWPEIKLELSALFRQNSKDLKASAVKRWIIDSHKRCSNISETNETVVCWKPEMVEESWCWNGVADGSFKFHSTCDNENIYIHIGTIDDTLITNFADAKSIQDKLIVQFSVDTIFAKSNFYQFEFTAGNIPEINAPKGMFCAGMSGDCKVLHETLEANLKIPKSCLVDDVFRLNIGFVDHDDPTNIEPSVIWWKPKWGSQSDYEKSGVFFVED